MSKNEEPKRRLTWMETMKALTRPKVAVMLALGFSSGLPFLLVGNTLGFWLRESGIELATIGFLSWVGLAYSLKFLWAPLIDKVDAPLFGRLMGRRRGWMILSQILIGLGLVAMAVVQPGELDSLRMTVFILSAVVAAFASATQDIVVDAWRIEVSDASEEMAMLSSAYQLGYRASMLTTDALILFLAAWVGWSVSFITMGALMGIGIAATYFASEPLRSPDAASESTSWSLRRLWDAIAGPFFAFFQQHGQKALLILAAVSLYRLSDFVMGPMINPFYTDLGLSKEVIASVRGSVGLIASVVGVAAAGISAMRLGFIPTLLLGAIVGPASNLGFSVMAIFGPSTEIFSAVMFVDNFSTGFAGTALIGYMSSLTTFGYTATQYALLSSFYALLGKVLKGFSGVAVEQLAVGRTQMDAFALFFVGTAAIGIPAFLLCLLLIRSYRTRDV